MSYTIIFTVLISGYLLYTGIRQLITGKIVGVDESKYKDYSEESKLKYAKISGIECIIAGVLLAIFELQDGGKVLPQLFNNIIWTVIGALVLAAMFATFFLVMKKKDK